jgi:hypothetical protein
LADKAGEEDEQAFDHPPTPENLEVEQVGKSDAAEPGCGTPESAPMSGAHPPVLVGRADHVKKKCRSRPTGQYLTPFGEQDQILPRALRLEVKQVFHVPQCTVLSKRKQARHVPAKRRKSGGIRLASCAFQGAF